MAGSRKRIRKLERIESAVMCIGGVFFLTILLAAGAIESETHLPVVVMAISCLGAGLCTYIGNRLNELIAEEIDQI